MENEDILEVREAMRIAFDIMTDIQFERYHARLAAWRSEWRTAAVQSKPKVIQLSSWGRKGGQGK